MYAVSISIFSVKQQRERGTNLLAACICVNLSGHEGNMGVCTPRHVQRNRLDPCTCIHGPHARDHFENVLLSNVHMHSKHARYRVHTFHSRMTLCSRELFTLFSFIDWNIVGLTSSPAIAHYFFSGFWVLLFCSLIALAHSFEEEEKIATSLLISRTHTVPAIHLCCGVIRTVVRC